MTRVKYIRDEFRHVLTAEGHASGSPEMCAAVSSIIYALAGWLANAAAGGGILTRQELNSGHVRITSTGLSDSRVNTAFEVAIIGLMQLEKHNPELVSVKIE